MRRPAHANTLPAKLTRALLRAWPLPSATDTGSKDERGSVLVVGGSDELPGSVLLAAEAALRAGAGKLQVATVGRVAPGLAVALPEAKVISLPDRKGAISRVTAELRKAAADADAVLIGCGMNATAATRRLVNDLVLSARSPLILDAGALPSIKHVSTRHPPLLLTPHLGEMASLIGEDRDTVVARQIEIAARFARKHEIALALKGATTLIGNKDGELWVYAQGPSGLGTSGSGDVLAGVIAGLIARGAAPAQALAWGVFVHGEAGRRLARCIGRVGFLAREILPEIPRVLELLSDDP
jgi:hydroxyethylthiazole kinase-like uncharacterized protein yjeF